MNQAEQFEVYENQARVYHELVSAEDTDGHLKRFLLQEINFTDKHVIEAGIGTGRVTQIYIDKAKSVHGFDQAQHMLDFARNSLSSPKLQLAQSSHADLLKHGLTADIFIQGWAFGHWFLELYPNFENTLGTYLDRLFTHVVPNGKVVFIETLGTGSKTPFSDSKLNIFYAFLENHYPFKRSEIRTDYQFSSVAQAARTFKTFFGDAMAKEIEKMGITRIPEVTGVWIAR